MSAEDDKQPEALPAPVRGRDGRWQRGGASPNPKGRPRAGAALAEAIRTKVDPDKLVEIALKIAESGAPALQLQALTFLAGSGYNKPETKHELRMGPAPDEDAEDLSGLSLEQLRELHELEQRRAAILARAASPALPGADGGDS